MSRSVVFLSTGLGSGGAETALLRLSRRLNETGTRCSVVSLGEEGVVGAELRRSEIPVWCLRLKQAAGRRTALATLRSALATTRPAVLQGWMYHGNLAATVAARLTHPAPALAWSVRQSLAAPTLDPYMTRFVIWLGAALSRTADAIVYNSALARVGHEAIGFGASKGIVLPNGFEADFTSCATEIESVRLELRVPPNAPLIGHVARWHPVKDHRMLLDAAAKVLQRHSDTVFALIGEGVDDQNRTLRETIATLGLGNNVRLLGRRTDTARLQSAFDIACLSSQAESFPNVIGEAMGLGVPCVSTAVGDVADLIADTGRVVAVGDADVFSRALLDLLALKREHLKDLGARARQRILQHFSIDSVAGQFSSLYEQLARDPIGPST